MLTWQDIIARSEEGNVMPPARVEKTEQEWQAQLSDETFRVTRKKGTERAFSSGMCTLFEPGRYGCVCCGTLLFDSGTGWPSFTQPAEDSAIAYHKDTSHSMTRVETTCATCDAHLGHVFPDGPEPSGLRFCMNAIALKKMD